MLGTLLRHTLFNLCSLVTVCWVSVLLVGRLYDFHTAYIQFLQKIEGEAWLYDRCNEDAFFKNMQYHTDVCEQVMSNRSISPVLHALNFSMQNMKSCGFTDCVSLLTTVYAGGIPVALSLLCLYVFTPSFIMPLVQTVYERHQRNRFVKNCTPVYRKTDPHAHPLLPGEPKFV